MQLPAQKPACMWCYAIEQAHGLGSADVLEFQYVELILEASLLRTISDLGLVKVPFFVSGVSRGIEQKFGSETSLVEYG